MSFRRRVAEYFPLARSSCLLCFVITFLSYVNDAEHDPVVGACVLAFGTLSIVSILITPTVKP